jgi:hypothetical protein
MEGTLESLPSATQLHYATVKADDGSIVYIRKQDLPAGVKVGDRVSFDAKKKPAWGQNVALSSTPPPSASGPTPPSANPPSNPAPAVTPTGSDPGLMIEVLGLTATKYNTVRVGAKNAAGKFVRRQVTIITGQRTHLHHAGEDCYFLDQIVVQTSKEPYLIRLLDRDALVPFLCGPNAIIKLLLKEA